MMDQNKNNIDQLFSGSIPLLYEKYMVPLIFEQYAIDLVSRVILRQPLRVLEIAAGTVVVTRLLSRMLLPASSIIATDINQAMIDEAAAVNKSCDIQWQRTDASQLPFADESFDLVVCQFGVMFFPDKPKVFSEVRRVLRPKGAFIFNVWDKIEQNEFAQTVSLALERVFPDDPPRFMARVPHGYNEIDVIEGHLLEAGFERKPGVTTVEAISRAESPYIAAIAYCQGTPLRNEIEARDPARLLEATQTAEAAIRSEFGGGEIEGKIQAHVIIVER